MSSPLKAQSEASPVSPVLAKTSYWFFLLIIAAFSGVLLGGFFFQFVVGENPCPLCLLQRMAMAVSALGAVYVVTNTKNKTLTSTRYMIGVGVGLLGAVTGSVFSIRQILLHILPTDFGYGEPFLGLHLYTWALITFTIMIIASGLILLGGEYLRPIFPDTTGVRAISEIVVWFLIAIIAMNAISVVFESHGAWLLPDNP